MNSAVSRDDPLLDCLAWLTRRHRRPLSDEALTAGLPLADNRLTPELFLRAAERAGFSARMLTRPLAHIQPLSLPAVLLLRDGGACLLTALDGRGGAEIVMPESGGVSDTSLEALGENYAGQVIFAHPEFRLDHRAHEHQLVKPESWLWGTLLRFRSEYRDVILATFFVNLFAVASSLFVMNVYDRVVPNRAMETLWVLASGIVLVYLFEFILRTLRGYFLDMAGKKADVLISARLFEQVMSLRMEQRPASAGAMASTLRDFESLRDFLSSATLTAVVDLPFLFVFIVVIALIGGVLAWVPLAAVPLVVGMGVLLQVPLARAIQAHQAEATQKHGVLVESIQGLETLKSLTAEGLMQSKWERLVGLTSRSGLRSRFISSLAVNLTQTVQQLVYVITVIVGVYLITDNTLTMGALIACTILGGRALAPLGQVANLMMRYQGARMALDGLTNIMQQETDRPEGKTFLHHPVFSGEILLENIELTYPRRKVAALHDLSLQIRPGERVAVLGKVGSGKSTLLKLLSGLYRPAGGALRFDGIDSAQIDPVDWRRNVGLVSQDSRLFFGTLRENLRLASPEASDAQLLAAIDLAGLGEFVKHHPEGLDLPIGEGGEGLSVGQRQAVSIARALLPQPRIVLLDEPTSAMDHNAEIRFIEALRTHLENRTLLLATHRPALLTLVERVVVLDGGTVVADGPRDKILAALGQK